MIIKLIIRKVIKFLGFKIEMLCFSMFCSCLKRFWDKRLVKSKVKKLISSVFIINCLIRDFLLVLKIFCIFIF